MISSGSAVQVNGLGLSLVSLAGVPPLSGFIAKWMVISVAWNRQLYPLLIVTLFAAVAALYYYLGPLKAMYWSEPLDETPIRLTRPTSAVLIALIVLLLVTGFWAQSISTLITGATIAQDASATAADSWGLWQSAQA